jgi:hypothetical protein
LLNYAEAIDAEGGKWIQIPLPERESIKTDEKKWQ